MVEKYAEKDARVLLQFALLKEAKWDKAALLNELKKTWGIEDEADGTSTYSVSISEKESGQTIYEAKSDESDEVFVLRWRGATIGVSYIPKPIPGDEIQEAAENNYLWENAVEETAKHQAHLIVTAIASKTSVTETGETLVKVVMSALKTFDAVGVYANDVVYETEYYRGFAEMMDADVYPVFNLVWVALGQGDGGLCAHTRGLREFGYDEIEVLNADVDPDEMRGFVYDIVGYVVTQGAVLEDGDTIGFSEEQQIRVTKSPGVALDGDTVKFEFFR